MSLASILGTGISASATTKFTNSNINSIASVDSNIDEALKTSDEVSVIVSLKNYEIQDLTSSKNIASLNIEQENIIENADLEAKKTTAFDRIPAITTKVDKEQLESLRLDPNVESISISNYFQPSETSIKQSAALRPVLNNTVDIIDADLAWAASPSRTGAGKKIVIIDTGVDSSHPFLSGAVVTQLCYAEGPDGPGSVGQPGSCPNGKNEQTGVGSGVQCTTNSKCGHGTHVAGIAAGRRSVAGAPIGGIAPDAQIVSIQVFSTYTNSDLNYEGDPFCSSIGESSPCISTTSGDLLKAFNYLLSNSANRANVAAVNMSLGGGLYSSSCNNLEGLSAHTSAITQLRNYGILTVVASGNDGSASQISWPACVTGAIAVGATTKAGAVASYSNSNSLIDFWGTGSDVLSSLPTSPDIYDGNQNGNAVHYGNKWGTSMATPTIAGAIAILRQAYPSESADLIYSRLQSSGTNITDPRNSVTKPRPSLQGALQYAELVRTPENSKVYLLNGAYKHAIGSLELFLSVLPIGQLRYVDQAYIDSFLSGPALSNVVQSMADSKMYLIIDGVKHQFSSCDVVEDYGYSCSGLIGLPSSKLALFSSGPNVSRLAKTASNNAVFLLEDGIKGRIASWADLVGIGIGTNISIVPDSILASLTTGDQIVTGGGLIKTADSVKVYAVNNWSGSPSAFQVASFDHTIDLGLGANFTIISNDQLSKYSIGGVLKTTVRCGSNTYIATEGVLYKIDPSLYSAFGYDAGTFQTGGDICNRFVVSQTQMSRLIKNGVSIYYMDGGYKRKYASYAAYVANGGLNATYINVSTSYINTLPTGAPITS